MDKVSESILALKPVTFHYKSDSQSTPRFGLIAEEVAEVNPDLVVCDKGGGIYTVRYDAVNAMLLNEFLKEHRRVEEQQAQIAVLDSKLARQEATIAQQQKEFQATTVREENEIRALTTTVKEQAAQITYEPFEHGTVLEVTRTIYAQEHLVYVFFDDGTFQQFDDTWQPGQPANGGLTPPPSRPVHVSKHGNLDPVQPEKVLD